MTILRDKTRDIHPKSLLVAKDTVVEEFDNVQDFMWHIKDTKHYSLDKFLKNVKNYEYNKVEAEKVANTVRNNLIKRGIITGTIYEGYKYDIEGDIVDYAELASGNPKCMMKPIKKYDKYFYELYINMSIPWSVSKKSIFNGAIRLVETIKALEELNVEIKVNIVLFSRNMFQNRDSYLFVMPLMSHLELKTIENLLPYMDGTFLRTALFACMKKDKKVAYNLGYAEKLQNSVNLWELKEEELARGILTEVGL